MKIKKNEFEVDLPSEDQGLHKISLNDFMHIIEEDGEASETEKESTFDETLERIEEETQAENNKIERYRKAKSAAVAMQVTNPKKIAAGAILLSITAGGLVFGNIVSNAAETNASHALLAAEYIDFNTGITDATFTIDELLALRVPYVIGEHGKIEAYSNCSIDYDNKMIVFGDKTQPALVKITPQSGYEPLISSSLPLSISSGIAEFEPSDGYGVISIKFVLPEEMKSAIEETQSEAASGSAGGSYITTSTSQSSFDSSSAGASQETPVSESYYEEPAYDGGYEETYYPTYEEETTTTYYQTYNGQTTSSTTPYTSSSSEPATTPHNMSSEELSTAKEIFDAYNDYRASCGLSRASWSDACANMAYSCSEQCAARGTLTHRLGIPVDAQATYSDILQYATWQMSGSEAVQKWIDSDGHRRQMRCASTSNAGVGVYRDSAGRWYYTIVYDFSGTNVG